MVRKFVEIPFRPRIANFFMPFQLCIANLVIIESCIHPIESSVKHAIFHPGIIKQIDNSPAVNQRP